MNKTERETTGGTRRIARRHFVELAAGGAVSLTGLSDDRLAVARGRKEKAVSAARRSPHNALRLSVVRDEVLAYCGRLRDKDGPYGCYRTGLRKRPDLYSSLDVALMRHIMGEDLPAALSPQQRREWIDHINSYQNTAYRQTDGSYSDTFNHSALHANGMVIGALGALGGRQKAPVKLYEAFNTEAKVATWLEGIDWRGQWRASHLFWGGMVCFSLSRDCPPAWVDRVINWLNANLDEKTGWWRKGVPHADPHQPLGGSVHILPIYQHHKRTFPYPERVIDSVLSLQLEDGRWRSGTDAELVHHYLELDALYALWLMRAQSPRYRPADVARGVNKYADFLVAYFNERRDHLFGIHPHWVLSVVGAFGLLQRLSPQRFHDDKKWTDIFSDLRLHDTKTVEAI